MRRREVCIALFKNVDPTVIKETRFIALVVLILLYIAAAVIHNRRRQRNHRRIDRK